MAHILLAEDDEAVRTFVKRALELDGHSVIAVEDGAEAAATLAHSGPSFDLLVSDIKMPVMDGIALALLAARDWPDLPVLLITGFADQRERANGLDTLVHDIVAKPFTLVEIRRAVQDAVNGVVREEQRRLYG